MTVVIFKNNKIEKVFKKYFTAFAGMTQWAEEKFPKAIKREVDRKFNEIRIYY